MKNVQPKRATLKDIARKAGVSSTAVSLVLNNKPNRFTEETRDLIRSIAEDMHYLPNQTARSLATQSSSLLALIIPDIENLFFASLAKHMENECRRQGYSLLIVDTSEDVNEQSSAISRVTQLGIDGLFIVPTFGTAEYNAQLLDELASTHVPVVFIDRIPEQINQGVADRKWRALAYDHSVGGRLAAQHLIRSGHTKIGVIGPVKRHALDSGNNSADNSVETTADNSVNHSARFEAFLDELAAHNIVPQDDWIIDGGFSLAQGYNFADNLLHAGVSAVFCGNDLIAVGFLRRAREQGYAVPADISLIGYDDVMGAFGLDFELTTIRQDVEQLAKRSCEMMLDAAYVDSGQGNVVLLKPELSEGYSVAKV